MGFEKWTQENKHDLRDLYGDFLVDSGCTEEDMVNGNCVSFSDFQKFMYKETIHAN